MSTISSLFDKYSSEIDIELSIDDINLKEIQMKLPALKHKWVARLIQHKREIEELSRKKEEVITQLIAHSRQESVVTVSDKTLRFQVESTDAVKQATENIKDLELLVEYIEKIEKIYSSTTYDLKNLIAIKQLELT